MSNAGILVHARHLQTIGWDDLMWGRPNQGERGCLPMVTDIILQEPKDEPFSCIVIGCGPSARNGMSESEFIKDYFLKRLPELKTAPMFAKRLEGGVYDALVARISDVVVTDYSRDTNGEIAEAARIFSEHNVTKVVQVASINHAPRCIRSQSEARASGSIPPEQLWSAIADDMPFAGETPGSTTIFEPPHRGDDPLLGFEPKMTEVFKSYQYNLAPEHKKELIRRIDDYMRKHST